MSAVAQGVALNEGVAPQLESSKRVQAQQSVSLLVKQPAGSS